MSFGQRRGRSCPAKVAKWAGCPIRPSTREGTGRSAGRAGSRALEPEREITNVSSGARTEIPPFQKSGKRTGIRLGIRQRRRTCHPAGYRRVHTARPGVYRVSKASAAAPTLVSRSSSLQPDHLPFGLLNPPVLFFDLKLELVRLCADLSLGRHLVGHRCLRVSRRGSGRWWVSLLLLLLLERVLLIRRRLLDMLRRQGRVGTVGGGRALMNWRRSRRRKSRLRTDVLRRMVGLRQEGRDRAVGRDVQRRVVVVLLLGELVVRDAGRV